MLRRPNDFASDFFPIDTLVQLFIHEPNDCYIITSHEVEAMTNLRAGFGVVGGPDNAFDSVVQNNIGDLIAGEESSHKSSSIDCYDQNFLCIASKLAY